VTQSPALTSEDPRDRRESAETQRRDMTTLGDIKGEYSIFNNPGAFLVYWMHNTAPGRRGASLSWLPPSYSAALATCCMVWL
jgi:hypothetical protein